MIELHLLIVMQGIRETFESSAVLHTSAMSGFVRSNRECLLLAIFLITHLGTFDFDLQVRFRPSNHTS